MLSSDYIYILPATPGNAISIKLQDGSSALSFYFSDGGRFDQSPNAIYGNAAGFQYKFDASQGDLQAGTNGVVSLGYNICGDEWFSPDGSRIYSGCGTVFHASTDSSVDMAYETSLAGLKGIQALSQSATANEVAAIPSASSYFANPGPDTEARLYEATYLNQIARFVLPEFAVGTNSYPAH